MSFTRFFLVFFLIAGNPASVFAATPQDRSVRENQRAKQQGLGARIP